MKIKFSRGRFAALATVVAIALLPACSSSEATGSGGSGNGGAASRPTSVDYPRPHDTDLTGGGGGTGEDESGISTVWGQVTVRATGEPYPGVTVEFKNLWGGNVHTQTDSEGTYSLRVPPDVYTALAMDLENDNAGFDVVGRPDNAVEVPPSTRVDFEGYPIVEGYQPVP